MTTIGAAWRAVRDRFRAAGLDTPEIDARFLAEHAFGMDRTELVLGEKLPAHAGQQAALIAYAERRLGGEPVARIIGAKAFLANVFALNEATLVPRPETELLVGLGLKAMTDVENPRILDLGTGSGCIAVSLLGLLPDGRAVATDLSPRALEAARENAAQLGAGTRLSTREGSWFEPIGRDEQFDLIVSNPPYIETGVIPTLQPEVRDFDPNLALDGGIDGLDAYRVILAGAPRHLAPGGTVILEFGAGQGEAVTSLARASGFLTMRLEKDLSGLDRALVVHQS